VLYLPLNHLEDLDYLDWMIHKQVAPSYRLEEYVFSMNELRNRVIFILRMQERWRENQTNFKKLEIPPQIRQRIQGTYKKKKLKYIYYVSTFFQNDRKYTEWETNSQINFALSLLHLSGARQMILDTDHLRSALCELKFLERTPDRQQYWKIE